MSYAPGGGYLVTMTDPEGFPANVVLGQEPINIEVSHPEKRILNYTGEKQRRREFNRFEPGPAAVRYADVSIVFPC
ncbi:Glyoxalase/Bleomycin resistance protein/Dihydroxybiphenyl dioxygenase [Penicillium lividum]|nr:Glyoxalase/Bleomycin resistance protein/Dihydroxybiphenyl dioxygenase [Penicillium lividum]